MEKNVRQLVEGKRVLEIGCRDGSFLKFLQDHGASVLGSGTGYKKKQGISIVPVSMEEVEKSAELKAFKPDLIVSMGLLDEHRFRRGGTRVPFGKLLRGIRHVATAHTVFYITPSVDSHSVIFHESLQRRKGIVKPVRHTEGKYATRHGFPIETHRFTVRPRRKTK
jgi:hypothetical protein